MFKFILAMDKISQSEIAVTVLSKGDWILPPEGIMVGVDVSIVPTLGAGHCLHKDLYNRQSNQKKTINKLILYCGWDFDVPALMGIVKLMKRSKAFSCFKFWTSQTALFLASHRGQCCSWRYLAATPVKMPFTGLNQGIPRSIFVARRILTSLWHFSQLITTNCCKWGGVSAKLALGAGLLLCFAEKIKRCLHSFNDGGIMRTLKGTSICQYYGRPLSRHYAHLWPQSTSGHLPCFSCRDCRIGGDDICSQASA